MFSRMVAGAVLCAVTLCVSSVQADDRATKILNAVDDLYRANASHAVISMSVKTKHYERTLEMEAWSQGKENSLIKILSPRKEKGTATLKAGNAIYTYLPKTDRTIRLSSGMMLGSWMGSHLTNDDLVKESRLAEDYTAALTFEGPREGRAVIELTLVPRSDAAVTWGKIVTTVEADTYVPIRTVYYDDDGVAARTMRFTEVREMGGRRVPSVLEMVPADKPGEFTRLTYKELELGIELPASTFSLGRLKR